MNEVDKLKDIISDDRAYWIDAELEAIKLEMGYGRYKIGLTKLAEESYSEEEL